MGGNRVLEIPDRPVLRRLAGLGGAHGNLPCTGFTIISRTYVQQFTTNSYRAFEACNYLLVSSELLKYGLFTLLDLCVSSLRGGHANLLCIVPISTDDPRRESYIIAYYIISYYASLWYIIL